MTSLADRRVCLYFLFITVSFLVMLYMHFSVKPDIGPFLSILERYKNFNDRNDSFTRSTDELNDSFIRSADELNDSSTLPTQEPDGWLKHTHWESKPDNHTYQYLTKPEKKCEVDDGLADRSRNLTLLVLVKSAPGHVELRDTIRKTYIQGALKYNVSCRTFFLLGYAGYDESKQAEIIEEAESHGDIIQEDFTDSYFNLTTKVIMGVKWTITFCKNSRFVLFTDDDVMIDIVTLVNDLSELPESSNFVLGQLTRGAAPIRNPKNKWYTPSWLYKPDKYPEYPQGHGYIMSQDVGPRLFRASLKLPPPVPWEDVYFGTLLDKIKVSITDRKPWYKQRHHAEEKTGKSNSLAPKEDYFRIELSVEKMHAIWNAIEDELTKNGT